MQDHMPAHAVAVCPDCKSILENSPEECKVCGKSLKIATNKYFASPDYIYYQRHALVEDIQLDKIRPGDSKFEEKLLDIQNSLDAWARECPVEDRLAALYDAYLYLAHVVFATGTTKENMRQMISVAKKIGDLGNSIEQYLRYGGTVYDRKIRSLRPEPGELEWNQASASAGGDSRT